MDRLKLTVTGPTDATPAGQFAPVDFLIENPAEDQAEDIKLTVTFGAGLRDDHFFRCTPLKLAQCPLDDSGNVARLPSGGRILLTANIYVNDGTTGNVAVGATITGANDDVLTDNGGQILVPTYTDDVSVTASTSANDVTSGANVPFRFVVSNAGPDAARNVTLTRTLGGRQTVTSTTCDASGGATCPSTLAADMTVPSLPAGGALTITFNSQVGVDALASVSAGLRADALGDLHFDNNYSDVSAYMHVDAVPPSPSFVRFQSDAGDSVGMGRDYAYTRVNSVFKLQQYSYYVNLGITGNEDWSADIAWPSTDAQFKPGTYVDLSGGPFQTPTSGALTIAGPQVSCGEHSDWFKVIDATYDGADLATLDLVFAQACKGRANALHGQIHWVANDTSGPPGPVDPPPAGLWTPAAGVTPASGSFVYLEGDAAEPLMHGTAASFAAPDSVLDLSDQNGNLGFQVTSQANYSGSLHAMAPYTAVVPGYFAIDPQAAVWNPVNPTLNVGSKDVQCRDAIGGWFVIDSVTHANGALTAVDARFEQHCGSQGTLHGQIHWRSGS